MNKLAPHAIAPILAIFSLAVLGAVMYYTYNALQLIFPGDLLGQIFGMTLFDLAALVWFSVFVKLCRSTEQYVFAGFGFLIAIGGTLGLVGIEIGISSGWLVADEMAKPLSYIFIVALVSHLVLIYARHAAEPEVSAGISTGIDKAAVIKKAEKIAEKRIEEASKDMAEVLAADIVRQAMRDLGLDRVSGQVIQLPALDVTEQPSAEVGSVAPSFLSQMFGWVGRGGRKFESNVPSVPPSSQPVTPKQSPAPLDAESAGAAE